MEKDEANASAFKAVDSALFVVCLDDVASSDNTETHKCAAYVDKYTQHHATSVAITTYTIITLRTHGRRT